jgi:SAM-dependent methyltransferase
LSNFINRLGGTMRLVDLLADGQQPRLLPNQPLKLAEVIWNEAGLAAGSGKLPIGLSALNLPPSLLSKILGELKNRAKAAGRSLRVVVPARGHSELSAASVRQNKLLSKGFEFVLIARPGGVLLGQTVAIHDPNRDAQLDRGIPAANARSGMLPPKLARMMVNCALGDLKDVTVYDPFCGNGRILLEAALQGYPVIGRDVDATKVEASSNNLEWLGQTYALHPDYKVSQQDATRAVADLPAHVIAAETWLGPPLHLLPYADKARGYAADVAAMLIPAIRSLLAAKPRRVVLAVPAWRLSGGGRQEVPGVLDVFRDNGYGGECIARYARSDSFVERVILEANPK